MSPTSESLRRFFAAPPLSRLSTIVPGNEDFRGRHRDDRLRLRLVILLALAALLAGGPCVLGSPAQVEFRAFVQTQYRFRSDLEGWGATAHLLGALFATAGPIAPRLVIDQPSGELMRLLAAPPVVDGTVRILYLGLHVDGEGRMIFADGTKARPGELVQAGNVGLWKPDVVVVDTCHAATFAYDAAWIEAFPCPHLFAADTRELAWEMDFHQLQPIHLAARYPRVLGRLAELVGTGWNGRISDLGFRTGKLLESGATPDDAAAFLRALASMDREVVKSTNFNQSTLLWVEPERLRELAR